MNEREILEELESAIEAMEQSLIIVTGLIAEQTNAGQTLRSLLEAEQAMKRQFGENAWRDRFLRRATQMTALKARRAASGDATLQSLIASVLDPLDPDGKDKRNH